MMGESVFVVAENPDPDSKLPYLLRVPLGRGELLFKAKDRWPRTARVYCHPLDVWPEGAVEIERTPVRSAARRGPAVDLVLDRGRENRSQFVSVTLRGGRKGILWQTAKTAKTARPGARIPTRRAMGLSGLVITVDSRERYAYRFAKYDAVTVERAPLRAGDYGVLDADGFPVAVVERKSLEDLAKSLTDGSFAFQLADLAAVAMAAVVVEDRYSKLTRLGHVQPGWALELLATLQARYPQVPIMFCETRGLAEDWTYRFLAAALAESQAVVSGDGPEG